MHEFKMNHDATPQNWRKKKIGDVFERVTQRNSENEKNVLTVSAQNGLVSQKEFFNRQVASENLRSYTLIRKGDFSYNKSYSAGYPFGVIRRLERASSGVVSPLYICFRQQANDSDSGFLTHYFEGGLLDRELASVAQEGIRNHGLLNVGVGDFFDLEMRLPPHDEQRLIADILDTLNDAIRKTEQLIAKLKQLKHGLLHDLLTRGINENGELRNPDGRPAQFKNSPLGRVPKEWEIVPFGDLCESSAFGPRFPAERYSVDGPLAMLRTTDMDEDGNIDLDSMPRAAISPATFAQHLLKPNDLLISRSGTCGITAVFPGHTLDVVPGAFLIRFRLRRPRLSHMYRLYFNSPIGRPSLERLAIGGVQKNIKGSEILALPVPLISEEECNRITQVIAAKEATVSNALLELHKLRLIKKGLTEELLTGRVRVTHLLNKAAP